MVWLPFNRRRWFHLKPVQVEVERLHHLLWNGYHEKAGKTLDRIVSWAETANTGSDHAMVVAKVGRLVTRCKELRAYIENNTDALIDYGQRYRAGKPVSSSRAESTVNQLVNARMNKRRPDALVASRGPSRAAGQGRGPG